MRSERELCQDAAHGPALANSLVCVLGYARARLRRSTGQRRRDRRGQHGPKNLPADTDIAEAVKCFGPQGVNGCGFESQLESMYLALARSADNNEASYGFVPDSAILAIVLLTDEADCSYNKQGLRPRSIN